MEFKQESLINWYIRKLSELFCNLVEYGRSTSEEVEQDHGKNENI